MRSLRGRILITSALLYANGPLHIGHLVEYIQTDIFVRFLRLCDEDVIYCCADDTHGAPIQINAEKAGMRPEDFIAKFFDEHVRDFAKYNINFDSYYSTNSPENKHYSELFFKILKEKGHIYSKEIEQLYCESCKRFLPDRYVKGECPNCHSEEQYGDVCESCGTSYKSTDLINPLCSICGAEPVMRKSNHYFFRLSDFEDRLRQWLKGNQNLQPEIVNSVMNWVDGGLQDWDITRDAPYFGFLIPGETDKYLYVWMDAPIGYISSTENYCKDHVVSTEQYWKGGDDSKIIHFIGKDIIYFHFLFWPAMLMGVEFDLPHNIMVHGFLNVGDKKMSKSRGTFYTAEEFASQYNPEYLRYYYCSMLSRKMMDINLDFSDFRDKINNDLVGNFGNFCYRIQTYINKNFDGRFKRFDDNKEIIGKIDEKVEKIRELFYDCNYKEAIREIMAISAMGNKYFQDNEPWKLIKTDRDRVEAICGLMFNIMKIVCGLLKPVMPAFSDALEKQLNLNPLSWQDLKFNTYEYEINKPEILLKKIEDVLQEEDDLSGKEDKAKKEKKEQKEKRLLLKAAEIVEAKDHPDSDKLMILRIDLGGEKRTLVAGLRGYYKTDELVGRKLIVVYNLKPAKIRGIYSQGMLLAAELGDKVTILEPKDTKPGEIVYYDRKAESADEITIEDFSLYKLKVRNHEVVVNSRDILKSDAEIIKVDIGDGARIR